MYVSTCYAYAKNAAIEITPTNEMATLRLGKDLVEISITLSDDQLIDISNKIDNWLRARGKEFKDGQYTEKQLQP